MAESYAEGREFELSALAARLEAMVTPVSCISPVHDPSCDRYDETGKCDMCDGTGQFYLNDAPDLRAATRVVRDSAEILSVLKLMFDSAYPHPVEHPTMFAAWGEARILLIRYGVIKASNPEDSL